jgi:hypothetical protein
VSVFNFVYKQSRQEFNVRRHLNCVGGPKQDSRKMLLRDSSMLLLVMPALWLESCDDGTRQQFEIGANVGGETRTANND